MRGARTPAAPAHQAGLRSRSWAKKHKARRAKRPIPTELRLHQQARRHCALQNPQRRRPDKPKGETDRATCALSPRQKASRY
eukprot:15476606-Alexandrium_andersonii.AAC.1